MELDATVLYLNFRLAPVQFHLQENRGLSVSRPVQLFQQYLYKFNSYLEQAACVVSIFWFWVSPDPCSSMCEHKVESRTGYVQSVWTRAKKLESYQEGVSNPQSLKLRVYPFLQD